jgi:predicted nucleotidyltransferase
MSDFKQEIIKIIRKYFKGEGAEIILFGSRAEGNFTVSSDYDIALKSEKNINESLVSRIKEDLENSNIPFKVDLVLYQKVSDDLKQTIDKNGITW